MRVSTVDVHLCSRWPPRSNRWRDRRRSSLERTEVERNRTRFIETKIFEKERKKKGKPFSRRERILFSSFISAIYFFSFPSQIRLLRTITRQTYSRIFSFSLLFYVVSSSQRYRISRRCYYTKNRIYESFRSDTIVFRQCLSRSINSSISSRQTRMPFG